MPYLHGGTGPALVLLHGFADQKETWAPIAPLLARKHSVIAPDFPGYGGADEVAPAETTLGKLSGYLAAFLNSMGRHRVHLCGNSMGGGVALRFAADFPDRVASLSLLASLGPEVIKSEFGRIHTGGDNPLIPGNLEEYHQMLEWVFAKRPPFPKWLQAYMAERQASRRQRLHTYFEVLTNPPAGESLPSDLESIDVPALVMHGTRDRVIHPSTGEALAQRLPCARHIILRGVGHGVQWEAPVRTRAAIEEVIRRATRQEFAAREEQRK
jgi:pimeloyl-ACP methyl ester carboxylesterase